jgi:tellurite resistance protein TehA-like permease
MGLATIINMMCKVLVPAWGPWVLTFAWALWWIDVVLACATNFYLPFVIMSRHEVRKYQIPMLAHANDFHSLSWTR